LSLIDTRVIYCGDNLEQLKKLPDACVDLIYIDPPFWLFKPDDRDSSLNLAARSATLKNKISGFSRQGAVLAAG